MVSKQCITSIFQLNLNTDTMNYQISPMNIELDIINKMSIHVAKMQQSIW